MFSSRILVVPIVFLAVLIASQPRVLAGTVTLTFQQGDGGAYSDTHGATVDLLTGTGDGSGELLNAYGWGIDPLSIVFVRFPNIIGNEPWQIPPGSTIESATLQLIRYNSSTWPALVRLVSGDWNEGTISGAALPGTSINIGSIPASGAGPQVLNVTAAVQVWAAGTANYGLQIVDGDWEDGNYQQFWSDDAPDLVNRPLLTVTFTPLLTPTQPSTWGKVKALYR